jgi:hypothetical protein
MTLSSDLLLDTTQFWRTNTKVDLIMRSARWPQSNPVPDCCTNRQSLDAPRARHTNA